MIDDKSLSISTSDTPISNPNVSVLIKKIAALDHSNRIKILCVQCRSDISGKANAVMLICPVCGKINNISKQRN